MNHCIRQQIIWGVLIIFVWPAVDTRAAHLVDINIIGIHSIMAPGENMSIGVTLQPYYSYVKNIVEDLANVIPLYDANFDPHTYQHQLSDIEKVTAVDVVVVNGIGHDDFALSTIESEPLKDVPIFTIPANMWVSLVPGSNSAPNVKKRQVNAHTFISITTAVQQIANISDALMRLDPANAPVYRQNTRIYITTLRKLKADYLERLAGVPNMEVRCAVTSDAYTYLLQEFGLEAALILEMGHGQTLTTKQLNEKIELMRQLNIHILFADRDFPEAQLQHIHAAIEVSVYSLSHLTDGEFTQKHFEEGIQLNLEAVTNALLDLAAQQQP